MKKGEMSMSVIIGAVIAIIILTVIVFMIARNSGNTNQATKCPGAGGICTDKICSKYLYDDNGAPITCRDSSEHCCTIADIQN